MKDVDSEEWTLVDERGNEIKMARMKSTKGCQCSCVCSHRTSMTTMNSAAINGKENI